MVLQHHSGNLLGTQHFWEDVRVVLLSDGKPYEKHTVPQLFEKQLLNTSPVPRQVWQVILHSSSFYIEAAVDYGKF